MINNLEKIATILYTDFKKTQFGKVGKEAESILLQNETGIVLKSKELVSELANEEHKKWARFMRYILSKCDRDKSGNFIIPANFVFKWIKQGVSQFDALEDRDKEKYKIEARKTLQIISRHFIKSQEEK